MHGFDEFFGYLYHLDAMSDPYWFDYPQDWIDKTGPRNLVHSYATDVDDPTVQPRWGKVGKQRIVDEGPLAPFPNMTGLQNWQEGRKAKYDMETFDDVLVKASEDFMDKAKKDGKPFFIWHNTTRMHVFTYLPPKYQAMMNATSNYNLEEAGMAQMDDSIGDLLKHLQDIGEADNTIVIFTTDNGAEVFTWPDGGMTPFKATKGTVVRRRLPRAGDHPLAGQGQAGLGGERHLLRPRLAAHARRCGRQSQHHRPAAEGREAGRPTPTRTIWTATTRWTCCWARDRRRATSCSTSADRSLARCGSMTSSSSSSSSPGAGRAKRSTTDMPTIINLRQDPFERTPSIRGESLNNMGGGYMNDFYAARVLALRRRAAGGRRSWRRRRSSIRRCRRRPPSTSRRSRRRSRR